jgi:hypothetical protein
MKKMVAAAALSLVFALPAVSSSQEVGRDQETWTWTGRVESGKWFTLSSVNGPVTIQASSDNMIHVRAEKEVREGSVRDVAFQVVEHDGGVTVCALWRNSYCEEDGQRSRRSDDDDDRRDRRDVRVKFTVQVPAGVRLSAGTVNGEMRVSSSASEVRASTVNGRVEVSNATGPVRASTVNGGVEVATRNGPVTASTVNGDIDVKMSTLSRDGDMKFNTVNGSITVEMPASLDAEVDMETMHGSLSSDYPVQISGRFGPRRARGTIGRGGRRIELDTLNGSVELRKAR